MGSKKILFFPQNETHLENMIPLLPFLERAGYSNFFFDASDIYHQKIYDKYPNLNLIKVDYKCEKPFYTYGALGKLKVTNQFKSEVKKMNHSFDGLVFGNDGALQRVLMKCAPIGKTFFQVDAIINDNTFSFWDIFKHSSFKSDDIKDWFRRKFKMTAMRVVRYLPYNYFMPSEIGTVKADRMYVMGQYVKEVLMSRGLEDKRIQVFGLPRFAKVFDFKHKGENLDQNGKFKVMTLTQSAVWHNDHVKEEVQKAQLFKLIDLIGVMRDKYGLDIELNIRLHPRDIAEDRSYFFEKDYVNLLQGELYPQLMEHDIVVATTSTVLVETLAINGRVAIMMLVDQWWRYKRSFLTLPCFHKFHNESSLEEYLKHIIDGGSFERAGLDMLISPKCKESAELISQDIIETLKG